MVHNLLTTNARKPIKSSKTFEKQTWVYISLGFRITLG